MANVPVPDALRDDLRASGLTVWEAKRTKKGEPIFVEIAGPGLPWMPRGVGLTIEDAVADALRNPHFQRERPGLVGAMARLDLALWHLTIAIRPESLDDDVPF